MRKINVKLTPFGDVNYLDAGNGNNTLYAQGKNNKLQAGTGNDNIQATGGNNTLNGGDGTNSLVADGGAGNNGRMRRRTHAAIVNSDKAANDDETHAWRIAA